MQFTDERIEDLFPLSELASAEDLRQLFENASVTFLLRACYEHLTTIDLPSSAGMESP